MALVRVGTIRCKSGGHEKFTRRPQWQHHLGMGLISCSNRARGMIFTFLCHSISALHTVLQNVKKSLWNR